jgi:muconolactone D-isomerase
MEFLVEFQVNVPDGTPESGVKDRENAEASAAAKRQTKGTSSGSGKRGVAPGETRIVGLYRADTETQLDGLLGALPLYEWMEVTVIPLGAPSQRPAPQTTTA